MYHFSLENIYFLKNNKFQEKLAFKSYVSCESFSLNLRCVITISMSVDSQLVAYIVFMLTFHGNVLFLTCFPLQKCITLD